jgi:TRAP-type C4-dicarboxylate transport system substrate-binding protein
VGKSKRWLLAVCFLVISVLFASCAKQSASTEPGTEASGEAAAETLTLRIGAGFPMEGSIWLEAIKSHFMPEVEKALAATNYKIHWIENWGTVAKPGEELEAIRDGILDVGFSSAAFEPSHLRISSMGFNTPFSSSDPEIIAKVFLRLWETHPEFPAEYEKANSKLIGIGVSESYQLITNFPIHSLKDLQGRKIAGASANQKWLQASGVTPVQSSLPDSYQSISSGVYDGFVIFPSSMVGYKLYEVAPYLTTVNFGSMNLGGIVVNLNKWNELPQEVQAAFEEAGKVYTMELAKISKSNKYYDHMEENGVQFSELPAEDVKAWAEKLVYMPQAYAEDLNKAGLPGTDLMKSFIQYQIEEGHQFPFPIEIK